METTPRVGIPFWVAMKSQDGAKLVAYAIIITILSIILYMFFDDIKNPVYGVIPSLFAIVIFELMVAGLSPLGIIMDKVDPNPNAKVIFI